MVRLAWSGWHGAAGMVRLARENPAPGNPRFRIGSERLESDQGSRRPRGQSG
jgi:hypothetical protein